MNSPESTGIPQRIAVLRTLEAGGYGADWEYEGAANVDSTGHFVVDPAFGTLANDAACTDSDTTHVASPFVDENEPEDGHAFAYNPADPLATQPSWGQPMGLAALSADVVLVAFQGYDYDDGGTSAAQVGRIAYTIDSGETWASVAFEGDYSPYLEDDVVECDAADNCTCDEAEFMSRVQGLELLPQPDRSYFNTAEDWSLEFFAVSPSDATGALASMPMQDKYCTTAKVTLVGGPDGTDAGTEPDVSTAWSWYGIDSGLTWAGCEVKPNTLRGVATATWGDEAFLFGAYSHDPTALGTASGEEGGLCTVDIDDPLVARTQVVASAIWQVGIGAVAPVLVLGSAGSGSWKGTLAWEP